MGIAMIGIMVVLMAGGLFGLNLHGGGKSTDHKTAAAQQTEVHTAAHDGGSSALSEKEAVQPQNSASKEAGFPAESR